MNYINNLFSLESKLAVVTGAARGNGKAIAEALLRAGATVVLVDRLKAALSKTTKLFKHEGLEAIMYYCDISENSKINDTGNPGKYSGKNPEISAVAHLKKLRHCKRSCLPKTINNPA